MPAPAWEDRSVFLRTDDFATEIAITMVGFGTRYVRGIFDDPFFDAQLGEYVLETSRPRVTCETPHLEGVRRGDTVTIDGKNYDVMTGPQPDGTGMSVLELAPVPGSGP